MKAKREHQVPLSDAALVLLAPISKDSDLVFPGTKGQPLSDMSLTAVIRRMNGDEKPPVWASAKGEGVTVHGFRSSFRMWGAETTAYPSALLEAALAHVNPNTVEASYQRSDLFERRRELMTAWGRYCAKAGNVVQLVKNSKAVS